MLQVEGSVLEWGLAARNKKGADPIAVIDTGVTCMAACLHCTVELLCIWYLTAVYM